MSCADFSPTRGHEQQGRGPALVVSDDRLNESAAGLALLYPLTTTEHPDIPCYIGIDEDARLPQPPFVTRDVRSLGRGAMRPTGSTKLYPYFLRMDIQTSEV